MAQPPTVLVVGAGVVGSDRRRCSRRAAAPIGSACPCSSARRLPAGAPTDGRARVRCRAHLQQLLARRHLAEWLGRARRLIGACAFGKGPDACAPSALDFDSADIGEPDLGHDRRGLAARTVLADAYSGVAASAARHRRRDQVRRSGAARDYRCAEGRRQPARDGAARRRWHRLDGAPPARLACRGPPLRAERRRHARDERGRAREHGMAAVPARRPARIAAARGQAQLGRLVAAGGGSRAPARCERRRLPRRARRGSAEVLGELARRARSASPSRCRRYMRCAIRRRASRCSATPRTRCIRWRARHELARLVEYRRRSRPSSRTRC